MKVLKNKIILTFFSGILMGATTAPVSAFWLAWIALVPLWIFIEQEKKLLKNIVLLAVAWGCGYHGLALFWITGVHPMTWMGVPWLASLFIAIFCWFFITVWGTALVVIWGILMNLLKLDIEQNKFLKVIVRVLIGVSLWCLLEFIWSLGDLWWTSLSYTQSPYNLLILQLGKFSGPTTITFSIVAVNGLLAESIINYQENKSIYLKLLLTSILLVLGLHLTGFSLYHRPLTQDNKNPIKVGIIQGNIPNEIKLYPPGWRKALEGYTSGYITLANQGVDLVLTPETALPFLWDDIVNNSDFYEAILDKKVPTFLGAFGGENQRFTNSLFMVNGDGKLFSRYDKVKLVPLGEYIPMEKFLGQFINRLSPLDAHLLKGKNNQVFDTPFGRVIAGICYESAFSEHFRRQTAAGGEFIITASNNAHYSPAMPAQHHAQDLMRAIEGDRWMARATNTGYSAIVAPNGRTMWLSGINTYEIHADTIYHRQTQTLYVKWGDWLMKALFVFIFGVLIIKFVQ